MPSVRDDMNPVPGHPNHNPDGILRGMGVSFVLDSMGNGGFPFLGFRTELQWRRSMESMCHLKCSGPSGVHVSPIKMVGPSGVHVSPEMVGGPLVSMCYLK